MIKLTCDKCGFNVESKEGMFQTTGDNCAKFTLYDGLEEAGFTMVKVDNLEYLMCKECYGTFTNVIIPRANTERKAIIDNWLKEPRLLDDAPRILGGRT